LIPALLQCVSWTHIADYCAAGAGVQGPPNTADAAVNSDSDADTDVPIVQWVARDSGAAAKAGKITAERTVQSPSAQVQPGLSAAPSLGHKLRVTSPVCPGMHKQLLHTSIELCGVER
jgi:hypothetical protein